jgi:transcriptional regulator with XRE-family HTH domain
MGPASDSETQLASDSGVNPPEQSFPIQFWIDHLSCCRNTDAEYGDKNIPNPILVKGESLPSASKSGPRATSPGLATRIKLARRALNLTQIELGERLGTTQSNVAKWERGDYQPMPEHLVQIARLLAGNTEALYFYRQAGIPDSFFANESAPMPEVLDRTSRNEKRQQSSLRQGVDRELLIQSIVMLNQVLEKTGRKITNHLTYATLVADIYEASHRAGRLTSAMVEQFSLQIAS